MSAAPPSAFRLLSGCYEAASGSTTDVCARKRHLGLGMGRLGLGQSDSWALPFSAHLRPGLGLLGAIHMFGSTSFYCSPAIAFWPFAPAAPFPAILASPLPLRRWLNAPVPGPCRGGRGSRAPPCKSEWGVRGAFSALVNKEESCPPAALKGPEPFHFFSGHFRVGCACFSRGPLSATTKSGHSPAMQISEHVVFVEVHDSWQAAVHVAFLLRST